MEYHRSLEKDKRETTAKANTIKVTDKGARKTNNDSKCYG